MSSPGSPAQRYARFRADQAYPQLVEFRAGYEFGFDDFQVQACQAVEDGHGVLVAAPTGSGKTIVGEFAVHLALAQGRKCFYTTPIKALSNQKYADLVDRHGSAAVGLLTGDTAINGDAPVVVMTTEVLRNMLYAGSRTLLGLGYVVMDEVHYLADRSRGAVWEEVIIHLPESVAVISLSATVSNAEEFGDWLSEVRGDTVTVVEERRPVPLYQHVLVGRQLVDLFEGGEPGAGPGAKLNPELQRIGREEWRASRVGGGARRGGSRGRGGGARAGRGDSYAAHRHRQRTWAPSRPDMVERLDRSGLLPAIVFIFSRKGCEAAVDQCMSARLRLTTPAEEAEVRAHLAERLADIPATDLHVLGHDDFVESLAAGLASHHAGLLPRFKECVEELFSVGLLKVVFATETLALGINMPARSVVIEKLTKWNGDAHVQVTPGEYTQLTGRAGRRGIDIEGHGVVLWQQGLDPGQLAGLASTRTYPLRSSFAPSYNMAVNLVAQLGRDKARQLLETSFAQYQADRAVVGMTRRLRQSEQALAGYADNVECDRGDGWEYVRLVRELSTLEKGADKQRKAGARDQVVASVQALRPGDVIEVPSGRYAGLAVVIGGGDATNPYPDVLTIDRHAQRLRASDFSAPVRPITRMKVPRAFNRRNPQARRDLASSLRHKIPGGIGAAPDGEAPPHTGPDRSRGPAGEDPRVAALRVAIRQHPVHACPDRADHLRWASRWYELERDTAGKRRAVESRTGTIARQFDRICEVLDALHYLDGDAVTPEGRTLSRLYSELDLVAAECLRTGVWDELDPPSLAAALTGLVYESRNPDDAVAPRLPRGAVRDSVHRMHGTWADLHQVERQYKVSFLRPPDFGFAWAAWRWASGAALHEVLEESEMTAGDFVRQCKQLLDVVDQVADAAGAGDLRTTARQASDALRRGVVAYSSLGQ